MSAFLDRPKFPALIEKFGDKAEPREEVSIDHAAEAQKIIDEYDGPDVEVWELADETEAAIRRDAFALALVHATLAVVDAIRETNR